MQFKKILRINSWTWDLKLGKHTHRASGSDIWWVPLGYTPFSRHIRLKIQKIELWPYPWAWAGSQLATPLPVDIPLYRRQCRVHLLVPYTANPESNKSQAPHPLPLQKKKKKKKKKGEREREKESEKRTMEIACQYDSFQEKGIRNAAQYRYCTPLIHSAQAHVHHAVNELLQQLRYERIYLSSGTYYSLSLQNGQSDLLGWGRGGKVSLPKKIQHRKNNSPCFLHSIHNDNYRDFLLKYILNFTTNDWISKWVILVYAKFISVLTHTHHHHHTQCLSQK